MTTAIETPYGRPKPRIFLVFPTPVYWVETHLSVSLSPSGKEAFDVPLVIRLLSGNVRIEPSVISMLRHLSFVHWDINKIWGKQNSDGNSASFDLTCSWYQL